MYKLLIRPVLFRFDSETAHGVAMRSAETLQSLRLEKLLKGLYTVEDSSLEQECFGLKFKNPIGLAAGFDKNAHAVETLSALGFGFIELGSITGQAQAGNPRPRIFRFPHDEAVINRMGFPSDGADAVAPRLARVRRTPGLPILGVNLGKTKVVPIDNALEDYLYTFERLQEFADYVALNVSSPNTPELRKLQERPRLEALFRGVQAKNLRKIPLLVKIAPDLDRAQLDEVLECCMSCGVDAVIATNTTFSREGLSSATEETGGLSGAPLRQKSLAMVRAIHTATAGKLPIVGVGGVFSGQDAFNLLVAGASLVQIYTGLIYEGPGIVRRVKLELLELLKKNGVRHLKEIIGKAQK
jgi:dihydroorotate dehydrogenase